MEKNYKFKVPASLDAITLEQYQKYVKVVTENKDSLDSEFIKLKVLEIFCGIPMNEAYELAALQIDSLVEIILKAVNEEPPLQRRFTMEDPSGNVVEFGFIPNLEKMSQGEYIDAEANIANWDNMHKAMAVFYRPITGSKGEFYEIEKYEGTSKYAAVMKDAPASVALGAMVFFYHLGTVLSSVILTSSMEEMMNQNAEDLQQQESPSEKSGDGTILSMHSQEETSLRSEKSQKEDYTNA